MRVAKIKGLIYVIIGLVIISTATVMTINSMFEPSEIKSTNNKVVITTEPTTVVATTKTIEETTKKIKETEKVTEKPTDSVIEKPTPTESVETTKPKETSEPVEVTEQAEPGIEELDETEAIYSGSTFRNMGVINWNGWRLTWYSERVLPGGGLNIPGRHADSSGYICDENEYICLSSSVLSKGTVIPTPFGKNGKVYDSGCASDTVDVYVNW